MLKGLFLVKMFYKVQRYWQLQWLHYFFRFIGQLLHLGASQSLRGSLSQLLHRDASQILRYGASQLLQRVASQLLRGGLSQLLRRDASQFLHYGASQLLRRDASHHRMQDVNTDLASLVWWEAFLF